jgi:hypothetical protein
MNPLHFDQLYLKVVQLAHNLRAEMILKGGEFLCQINYLHGSIPPAESRAQQSALLSLVELVCFADRFILGKGFPIVRETGEINSVEKKRLRSYPATN